MTADTWTIADFLLARIAEDEADARPHADSPGPERRWVSNRVLAECEAKRRIVEEHVILDPAFADVVSVCAVCHDYSAHDAAPWPCRTLRALATIYADHPDYRDEWRA